MAAKVLNVFVFLLALVSVAIAQCGAPAAVPSAPVAAPLAPLESPTPLESPASLESPAPVDPPAPVAPLAPAQAPVAEPFNGTAGNLTNGIVPNVVTGSAAPQAPSFKVVTLMFGIVTLGLIM